MATNISFVRFFSLSPETAQFCRHFHSISFTGIKANPERAERVLRAFKSLSSLTPDANLKDKIRLEVPHGLASIDALFNPPVPGHRLSLEISRNRFTFPDGTVRKELLAMRWTTFFDINTKEITTLGSAFVLTGEIEKLLK